MRITFTVLFFLLGFFIQGQPQVLRAYLPVKKDLPQALPYIRLMDRLGSMTGVTFHYLDDYPAARAKWELKNGTLDVSVGTADVVYADILGDIVDVDEPLLTGRHLVVTTAPFQYRKKEDLAGKSVLSPRETAAAQLLISDKTVNFIVTQDPSQALRMLLAGRGEVLVIHELLFQNALRQNPELKDRSFFIADTPYMTVKNKIWLSKNHQVLAGRLNTALRQLIATGEFAKIMELYRPGP